MAIVRINLLPHREEKRKLKKQAFGALMLFGAIVGALVVAGVGGWLTLQLSAQEDRNKFIETENKLLDRQIKEVAGLQQEIEALRARQQSVEDLQADRNQPVYLLDELTQHIPEGIYLSSFRQNAQRIQLKGFAQSNERVSELLRNFSGASPWLRRPDLVEIRSVNRGSRRIFEFTVNVDILRPRDREAELQGDTAPAKGARKS